MNTIELPTRAIKATEVNPKRLVVYAKPKTGKTTALAGLENNLILDLEDGTDYLDALKVKIRSLDDLKEVGTKIKEAGHPYKFVSIDPVTVLEDLVGPLAIKLYRDTPMGAKFSGDNILKLANGAGYLYLRQAFFQVLDYIDTFAKYIILSGHIIDKKLDDNGSTVSAANIDLTGKIRTMICSTADAVGYIYRKEGKTIISFISNDEITCGARCEHLRNQEIVLVEQLNDGKFKYNWDKIYK